jgi:predicted transposase/invertase (TIGR01784 family)
MQNHKQAFFLQRAQYYVAKTYSAQLSKGDAYLELRPVILLAILNDAVFPDDIKPISYHHTLEVETAKHYLKDMSYAFIELPKFNKPLDALESLEDYWLHLFKQAQEDQSLPPNAPTEIAKAYDTLEQYKWSPQEKEAYERAQMAILDETDRLKTARDEGREEGREEGRQEGEAVSAKKIARNLLSQGVDVKVIAAATGLDVKKIQALKSS